MTDECLELKNIKYKTMLLNNNAPSKIKENINDINTFLKMEKESLKGRTWSKLSNASKLQKLILYSEKYSKKHNLNKKTKEELKNYLIEAMEKKKLQRIKDVTYDIKTNLILNIQGLTYNNTKKKFTLKNKDKKTSTLKSLPPFKKSTKKTKKDKLKDKLKDKKRKEKKHKDKDKKHKDKEL